MSGRYLLDTNIIIALFANETVVKDSLAQAHEVFLPTVAIGKLYYDAQKSGQTEANLAQIDELVVSSTVLGCDVNTARQYGKICFFAPDC
nr:PIN domain-containing protein [Arthrospira sp. PLM2.Bin9]